MSFKMKKSPLKKGPCGTPGYPSCEEELKKLARQGKYPKSYIDSIKLEDAGLREMKGRFKYFLGPGNVGQAVGAETSRRVKDIVSDPGYTALTQNPEARPIVGKIDEYIRKAEKAKGRRAQDYVIPTYQEAKGLLDIGRKYTGSKDISEDITVLDKLKAITKGGKLLFKYPNLRKIADKYK